MKSKLATVSAIYAVSGLIFLAQGPAGEAWAQRGGELCFAKASNQAQVVLQQLDRLGAPPVSATRALRDVCLGRRVTAVMPRRVATEGPKIYRETVFPSGGRQYLDLTFVNRGPDPNNPNVLVGTMVQEIIWLCPGGRALMTRATINDMPVDIGAAGGHNPNIDMENEEDQYLYRQGPVCDSL